MTLIKIEKQYTLISVILNKIMQCLFLMLNSDLYSFEYLIVNSYCNLQIQYFVYFYYIFLLLENRSTKTNKGKLIITIFSDVLSFSIIELFQH